MKTIKEHIKNQSYAKVYLLTGDEEYLIRQARTALKNALVRPDDTMNYRLFEDGKINMTEVESLAGTYPFFSEKRLLVFDRTDIVKSGKDALVKLFDEMPETTVIIICEPEADKRTKAYKWIKKNGYIGEFLKKDQTTKVLLRFIAALLAKEQIQIRESDAMYFLELVGNDMFQIRNEADKLIAYMGEEKIVTTDMIDTVVSSQVPNKIFDLVTAIADGDKETALKYYGDLIVLKEQPMHILYLIVRQYRILNIIKNMRKERRDDTEIAAVAGVPKFAIRRYEGQIRKYTQEKLADCLKFCVETEQSIKEGRMGDQLALETLIVRMVE